MDKIINTSEKWKKGLKDGGYDYSEESINCDKIKKFSRIWKRILNHLDIKELKKLEVLEIGCGGGKHLAMFALNGSDCTGIDVSEDVLKRARSYFERINNNCGVKFKINLILDDFFKVSFLNKFDIVFSVGVIEHFLDNSERFLFQEKAFNLLKPGGYLITIVPSGIHPLRKIMKEEGLGGYDIPEIDYNPAILKGELKKCGGSEIIILGHNIFNYILLKNNNFLKRIFYLMWQLVPLIILPKDFIYKYSDTLIAIAKK